MNISLGNLTRPSAGPGQSIESRRSDPSQEYAGRMSHAMPVSLPPMSTLWSGPGHSESPLQQQTYQPQPYHVQPRCENPQHPLYLSDINPSAPIQHIYHAPQESTHVPQYQANPVLIQMKPAERPVTRLEQLSTPPLIQRRQSKKISQRRDEIKQGGLKKPVGASQERFNSSWRRDPSPVAQGDKTPTPLQSPAERGTSSSHTTPSVAASPPSNRSSKKTSDTTQFGEIKCRLTVRQQPIAARACGFGERDRRVIDPPPILHLITENPRLTVEEMNAEVHQLRLVAYCTLWDPVTDEDASAMPLATEKRQQRRLMGTLVSSPFVGKDEFDVEGCFFTFPDLSVRTPGNYSLRFSLVFIPQGDMAFRARAPINAVVKSQPFDVFNAKDFGGMRASTELTKRLKQQGCLISVKKGNTKNGANIKGEGGDREAQDDDDDDDAAAPRGPAPKRQKQR